MNPDISYRIWSWTDAFLRALATIAASIGIVAVLFMYPWLLGLAIFVAVILISKG